VGTSDGDSAELRTAPPPSASDYLHNEKTRDAGSNSDDARRTHTRRVPPNARVCG